MYVLKNFVIISIKIINECIIFTISIIDMSYIILSFHMKLSQRYFIIVKIYFR